jgi:hypothetical protein
MISFEIVSGSSVTEWLERGHENLFKIRNNALNNIWAMIQKEYWCLIWNMNMQSASSIWSNLLSNVNIIKIVRNCVRWG